MKTVFVIAITGGLVLSGFALTAQTVTPPNDAAQPAVLLSICEVSELALAQKAGTVTEIEWERDNGQTVYEVKIRTEDGAKSKVVIGAETGEVLAISDRKASQTGKWWGKWWSDGSDDGYAENDHGQKK